MTGLENWDGDRRIQKRSLEKKVFHKKEKVTTEGKSEM